MHVIKLIKGGKMLIDKDEIERLMNMKDKFVLLS